MSVHGGAVGVILAIILFARRHKLDILALAEHNRTRFGTIQGVVEKYLDKCGRRWVAMDTLFGKLGFAATGGA